MIIETEKGLIFTCTCTCKCVHCPFSSKRTQWLNNDAQSTFTCCPTSYCLLTIDTNLNIVCTATTVLQSARVSSAMALDASLLTITTLSARFIPALNKSSRLQNYKHFMTEFCCWTKWLINDYLCLWNAVEDFGNKYYKNHNIIYSQFFSPHFKLIISCFVLHKKSCKK